MSSCFIQKISKKFIDAVHAYPQFGDFTEREIRGYISSWQSIRGNNKDEVPSVEQLVDYMNDIHNQKPEQLDNINALDEELHNAFTTKEIENRAFRISRLFSEAVDNLVKNELKGNEPNMLSSLQMRKYIINQKYGIPKILSMVKSYIKVRYINFDNVKERIYNVFVTDASTLTDEDKAALNDEIEWQINQGKLMLEHFDALLIHANFEIRNLESVSVISNAGEVSIAADENLIDNEERSKNDIEYYKKAHEESAEETLDREIWSMVNNIYDLDADGNVRDPQNLSNFDDFYEPRPLSAKQVSATLWDICSKIIECEDMIPTLISKVEDFPWLQQIVDMLCGKDSAGHNLYNGLTREQRERKTLALQSKFWNGFHKIQVNMGVQRMRGDKLESVIVNNSEGMDAAMRSFEEATTNRLVQYYTTNSGETKTFPTVYGPNGEFKKDVFQNISKHFDIQYMTGEDKDIRIRLNHKKDLTKIQKFNLIIALKAFGITTSVDNLRKFFTVDENADENTKSIQVTNISRMYQILHDIYNTSAINKAYASVQNIDNINVKGIFEIYSVKYRAIAELLGKYQMGYEESVARYSVDGEYKKQFSHILPNPIHKIIYKLANIDKANETKYKSRIQKDFLSNWFFSRDKNTSLNVWIRDLLEFPELREHFQLKSLKSSNGISYAKEIDAQAELTRLNEFDLTETNVSVGDNKTIQTCYYSVPTFSDTGESYYIRARKYTEHECVNNLVMVLKQELDRMNVVATRAKLIRQNPSIHPIASYDMILNDQGKIIKPGGYQFFFFPSLNAKKKEIIDHLNKLENNETEKEKYLKSLVQEALNIEYNFYCSKVNQWNIHKIQNSRFTVNAKDREDLVNYLLGPIKGFENELHMTDLNVYKNALYHDILSNQQFHNIIHNISTIIDDYANTLDKDSEKYKDCMDCIKRIGQVGDKGFNDTLNNKLRSYFLNSYLANTQIIELTMGDPAFLDDPVKFQKRFKMFYSPVATCYTSHYMYDDSGKLALIDKYTKDTEVYCVLKDTDIVSNSIKEIKEFIIRSEKRGLISKADREDIEESLEHIVSSDAQCYRSITSWEYCLNMIGKGDNVAAHEAIEHMKKGTFNAKDFWVMWQIFKPFVCSYSNVETHIPIEGKFGLNKDSYKYIKTPIQHKNSEFLLLALYNQLSGVIKNHPKLVAINEFMEKHGIDKMQFETAVKTGCQAPIDLNIPVHEAYINGNTISSDPEGKSPIDAVKGDIYEDFRTRDTYTLDDNGNVVQVSIKEQITNILETYTGLKDDTKAISKDNDGNVVYNGNPDVVHTYPMKDWGISTSMPEHLLEHDKSSLGTQLMKVILENIDKNEMITFGNVPITDESGITTYHSYHLTGDEWIKLYQAIFTQNLTDDFGEVEKTIKSPKQLVRYLKKQIITQNKLPKNLLYHLELNEEGDFKRPLIDPMLRGSLDSYLASLLRNDVRKQDMKMGALPQVSSWGIDNDLSTRFQDKDGVLIFKESEWNNPDKVLSSIDKENLIGLKRSYSSFKEYDASIDKGNIVMRGVEVYIPIYDMQIIRPFVDENGVLDEKTMVEKLDPSLLNFIGYRVPTEAEHSIAPMIIKGFLPYQNSSCAVIAPEWIAMSDSDNDGDKLYAIFYELTAKLDKSECVNAFLATEDGLAMKAELHNEKFAHDFTNVMFDIDYRKISNLKTASNILAKHIGQNKDNPQSAESIRRSLDVLQKYYPKFRAFVKEQGNNPDNIKKIVPVQYRTNSNNQQLNDYEKLKRAIKYNSRSARNNLIVDMIRGALQTQTKSLLMMTPGGFSEAKRVFKLIQLLENPNNVIDDVQYNTIVKPNATVKETQLAGLSTNLDNCSICNPAIRTIQQTRNMAGAELISIYANYRSAWPYLQLAPSLIINKDNRIVINNNESLPKNKEGVPTWSFNSTKNNLGEYISNNIYQFLGSAVDNAKESLLSFLGQTNSTAAISMALIYAGYSVMDVALFMNQPVIKYIVRKQAIEGGDLGTLAKRAYISLVKLQHSSNTAISQEEKEYINTFDAKLLAEQIHNNAIGGIYTNFDYQTQMAVIQSFRRFLPVSTMLNNMTQVTKANTYNGSAQSHSSENQNLILNIKASAQQASSTKSPIIGADVFFELANVSASEIPQAEVISNTTIPMLSAFEYYCVQSVENLYKGLSLTFNDFVVNCQNAVLMDKKHNAKQVDMITDAAATYIFSEIKELNPTGNIYTERLAIFTTFLSDLLSIKVNHLIENNMLIDDIIVNTRGIAQTLGVGYITLKRSVRANPAVRDSYVASWMELYNSNDKTVTVNNHTFSYRDIANYLFRYCFYTNGLSSAGVYTLLKMFSTSEINHIDGYEQMLHTLTNMSYNFADANLFADQFAANNPNMVAHSVNVKSFIQALNSIISSNNIVLSKFGSIQYLVNYNTQIDNRIPDVINIDTYNVKTYAVDEQGGTINKDLATHANNIKKALIKVTKSMNGDIYNAHRYLLIQFGEGDKLRVLYKGYDSRDQIQYRRMNVLGESEHLSMSEYQTGLSVLMYDENELASIIPYNNMLSFSDLTKFRIPSAPVALTERPMPLMDQKSAHEKALESFPEKDREFISQWCSLEGWSAEHYKNHVHDKVIKGEAWQLQYEYLPNDTEKHEQSGNMTFEYGKENLPTIKSKTTLEAIRNGERTATTRYESNKNIEYWKNIKVNSIVTFFGNNGDFVNVRITKAATKLVEPSTITDEQKELQKASNVLEQIQLKPIKVKASLHGEQKQVYSIIGMDILDSNNNPITDPDDRNTILDALNNEDVIVTLDTKSGPREYIVKPNNTIFTKGNRRANLGPKQQQKCIEEAEKVRAENKKNTQPVAPQPNQTKDNLASAEPQLDETMTKVNPQEAMDILQESSRIANHKAAENQLLLPFDNLPESETDNTGVKNCK